MNGIELIATERQEQIEKHGFTNDYTYEHPEYYEHEQLTVAAIAMLDEVPEGSSDYCVSDVHLEPTFQWWIAIDGIVNEVGSVCIPEGNWQIVGNPLELSSEVIIGIVPEMKDNGYPFEIQDITDTWKDLLDKWKIYQTNPHNEDRMSIEFHYDDGKASKKDLDDIHDKWEDAQERAGSFILLKKIV